MPVLLTIADHILRAMLLRSLDAVFNIPAGYIVGCRPGAQTVDVAHACHCVFEKGLDMRSEAAVAEADIEKYYDSLDPFALCTFLSGRGVDESMLAAVLNAQMSPSVKLRVGSSPPLLMRSRSSAALTGSRLAGSLGQIPILHAIESRRSTWYPKAFSFGGEQIILCTWIDNLFSFSNRIDHAIDILADLEQHIMSHWNLRFKADSRMCAVAHGNPNTPRDPARWPLVSSLPVLGHGVDADAGIACTKRTMWTSFWAKSASKKAGGISVNDRLKLLDRTVVSQFRGRVSRWPFQKTIALALEATQCAMTARLL